LMKFTHYLSESVAHLEVHFFFLSRFLSSGHCSRLTMYPIQAGAPQRQG
jgi:hypothetical protein